MAAKVKYYTYENVHKLIKKALNESEGSYKQTDDGFLVEWYFDKRNIKHIKDKLTYKLLRSEIADKKRNMKANSDAWMYTSIDFGEVFVIFNSYQTYMFYPTEQDVKVDIYYH
jgi:hypothetical protein